MVEMQVNCIFYVYLYLNWKAVVEMQVSCICLHVSVRICICTCTGQGLCYNDIARDGDGLGRQGAGCFYSSLCPTLHSWSVRPAT